MTGTVGRANGSVLNATARNVNDPQNDSAVQKDSVAVIAGAASVNETAVRAKVAARRIAKDAATVRVIPARIRVRLIVRVAVMVAVMRDAVIDATMIAAIATVADMMIVAIAAMRAADMGHAAFARIVTATDHAAAMAITARHIGSSIITLALTRSAGAVRFTGPTRHPMGVTLSSVVTVGADGASYLAP